MSWAELGDWWVGELASDSAYEGVVTPLLLDLLEPVEGYRYLDLGCGDGRVMRSIAKGGATAHGVELNFKLAVRASQPVVLGELPDLRFLAPDSYDGAYCVLVLEHIDDHAALFEAVADVVRTDGVLVVVMNHPVWTAPGSTPITDVDGEVLWRPGDYFSSGTSDELAGATRVTFHHRTVGSLLTTAAEAGWSLERIVEQPHHELDQQRGIPRLLGCRWRLLP